MGWPVTFGEVVPPAARALRPVALVSVSEARLKNAGNCE